MRLLKDMDALTMQEWILLEEIHFSPRQIECLWEYYWMGRTQKEIAEKLKISRPVVAIYLKRARDRIKKYFNIEGKIALQASTSM